MALAAMLGVDASEVTISGFAISEAEFRQCSKSLPEMEMDDYIIGKVYAEQERLMPMSAMSHPT
jgi:hypothetical protein